MSLSDRFFEDNTNTLIENFKEETLQSFKESGASDNTQSHIKRRAKALGVKMREHLRDSYPHTKNEQYLQNWNDLVEEGDINFDSLDFAIKQFFDFCSDTQRYANELFWNNVLMRHRYDGDHKNDENLLIDAQILLTEWRKNLYQNRAEWEMEELLHLRSSMLEDLDSLIEALEDLESHAHDADLDPGVLLDLSTAPLTPQEIESLKNWVEYIRDNENVRTLCEMLGKMRDTDILTDNIDIRSVIKPLSTVNSTSMAKEEITGIRLGRDLECALPSELSLLSTPEVALCFDVKYFESRITSFNMDGLSPDIKPIETIDEDPEPEKENLGPMIICIDTSGSMAGAPETIGKAVTLFMAYQAKRQKRPCYIINFATEIETIQLDECNDDADLISFLQMSFHSGTSIGPALSHSITMMDDCLFEKSDLLVISDFIVGHIPDDIRKRMELQRNLDNRFYSLVIGEKFMYKRNKTLFDREWVFDAKQTDIYEVTGNKNDEMNK
ncbi:MAG: VWA domain-containing protein [Gammaproteobacteria bacterium]|nr:VWA domain-containing protein [Gammaproteobacteria bacterium]